VQYRYYWLHSSEFFGDDRTPSGPMNLRKLSLWIVSGYLMGFLSRALASSVVLYNNYGPNDAVGTWAWAVSGAATSPGYRAQGQSFTPQETAYLSTVELSIYRYSGSGRVNVSLVEDAPTGTLLERFSYVAPSGLSPRLLNSTAHPLLEAGTTYWLLTEPYDDTSYAGWVTDYDQLNAPFAYGRSPGSWEIVTANGGEPEGVFRITATAIPEPGPWALLMLASIAVGIMRASSAPTSQTDRRRLYSGAAGSDGDGGCPRYRPRNHLGNEWLVPDRVKLRTL
jgi:hypothetical protein